MTIKELKQNQRAAGIAARCALTKTQRQQFDREITEKVLATEAFQKAKVIFSYCAVRGEVDAGAIEQAARLCGKEIAYPVCRENGQMIAACPETETAMQKGRYGILEPKEGAYTEVEPEEIDLVLVPCSAFDETCVRVGMGGGYYDRYLPRCKHAQTIALAYEAQKVCNAAKEIHDAALHAVITENTVYKKT